MIIYINTPGSYLHVNDGLFEIKVDGDKKRVSPKKVESILISVRAMLTTDAVELAIEHNIDIVLLDKFGEPFGRFWRARFGSTALIRRKQLEISSARDGLKIGCRWICLKLEGFVGHLDRLKQKRKPRLDEIEDCKRRILEFRDKIDKIDGTATEVRNIVMAYEGNAGRYYFEMLSKLMPLAYRFDGRSFRPAHDEFNCMINYGFGILYHRIEKACVIAGLDPYIGIIHADNYNKPSLTFDIIEAYRYMIIEPAFKLFTRKSVKKGYFKEVPGGFTLDKEGKIALAQAVTEEFDKKIIYHGRKLRQIDVIQAECHGLANKLIGLR